MTTLDASIVIGTVSLIFIILNFIKIRSPVIKIGNSYTDPDRAIGFVPVFENITNNPIPEFSGCFLILLDNSLLIGSNYNGSIPPKGNFRVLHNVWRFAVNNGMESDPLTPEKREKFVERKPQLLIECNYHSFVFLNRFHLLKKSISIKYVWDDAENEWRFPQEGEWKMPELQ